MCIDDTLAKVVLNAQPVEELPDIATRALCNGLDSPALRILAGLHQTEHPQDIWTLFRNVVRELGLLVPDKLQAARRVLRIYLRDIVEQRISPAEGVGRIIRDVQNPVGEGLDKSHVGEALGIGGLVGDYYTYPDASSGLLEFEGRRVTEEEAIKILDRSILEEAKRLLQTAEHDGLAKRSGESGLRKRPPSRAKPE